MLRLVTSAALASLLSLIWLAPACLGLSDTMSQNLERMRKRWAENPKDLESVYVYMTSAAQDPIEKGVVYQNIVSMFAQKGTRTYAKDIAKYTESALQLPYRSADLAQMYLDVGDGVIADAPKGADGTPELKETDRTEVATWYLRALKILLDTISFDEQETPEPAGASPAVLKTTKDHNAMIARRNTCLQYLRDLYGTDPDDLAKLRELASHSLGEKGREDMLLRAMRGEPAGDSRPVLASLPAANAPAADAPSATPPQEASSFTLYGIVGLVVVAAAGLFWFLRKRPAS